MTPSRFRFAVLPSIVACACLVSGGSLAAQRGEMGAIGITIYAEPSFRGMNANFRTDVPDLRKVGMNDRVDSLKIPRGEFWQVCENINYGGRCQIFSGDESDLNRVSWGGMISSLRRVKDAGPVRRNVPIPAMHPRMILFDDVGYKGDSFLIESSVPKLRAAGNRARSVKVYSGTWELCDGDNFTGHCKTINASDPNLWNLGLKDKISSVRPVDRMR